MGWWLGHALAQLDCGRIQVRDSGTQRKSPKDTELYLWIESLWRGDESVLNSHLLKDYRRSFYETG